MCAMILRRRNLRKSTVNTKSSPSRHKFRFQKSPKSCKSPKDKVLKSSIIVESSEKSVKKCFAKSMGKNSKKKSRKNSYCANPAVPQYNSSNKISQSILEVSVSDKICEIFESGRCLRSSSKPLDISITNTRSRRSLGEKIKESSKKKKQEGQVSSNGKQQTKLFSHIEKSRSPFNDRKKSLLSEKIETIDRCNSKVPSVLNEITPGKKMYPKKQKRSKHNALSLINISSTQVTSAKKISKETVFPKNSPFTRGKSKKSKSYCTSISSHNRHVSDSCKDDVSINKSVITFEPEILRSTISATTSEVDVKSGLTQRRRRNKLFSDPIRKNLKTSTKGCISDVTLADNSIYLSNVPVDDITMTSYVIPSTFNKCLNNIRNRKQHNSDSPYLSMKSGFQWEKPVRSSDGELSVLPNKGTLKRKRYIINSLKNHTQGYEDDIFENKKLGDLRDALQMEEEDGDSDISAFSISTPTMACVVTPNVSSKTPRFKDCYSPYELIRARKLAEEYIHRRNKKRRNGSSREASLNEQSASQVNTRNSGTPDFENFSAKKLKLSLLAVKANEIAKELNPDYDGDESDKDDYFSDG